MSIATPADFVGIEIGIANGDDAYNGVQAAVQQCIDEYEPEFLKALFGDDLYTAYLAGVALDPIDAKWTALEVQSKPSILRYVYYYWVKGNNSYQSGTGTSKAKQENATMVPGWDTMVAAWNKMVKKNVEVRKFIEAGDYDTTYPTYWAWWAVPCDKPEILTYKNTLDL